jgi:hypothetical protein
VGVGPVWLPAGVPTLPFPAGTGVVLGAGDAGGVGVLSWLPLPAGAGGGVVGVVVGVAEAPAGSGVPWLPVGRGVPWLPAGAAGVLPGLGGTPAAGPGTDCPRGAVPGAPCPAAGSVQVASVAFPSEYTTLVGGAAVTSK